ncbi:MAG TPA: LysR family transcriptional regulator [Pseudonocardia sp.]|jgi:DNA-binding transcriptional LysR family regulator|nr:LysR family transcriptional regulator [Pseudonocardia sp.]
MEFSWERLRVFNAVAEHSSIGAAAAALYITAPAVSQQVRKLEREARCPLIEPDGRGIRLTAAGRVLAESVRVMAGAAHTAAREISSLDDLVVGPLRIGSMASMVRTLLPGVLRNLAVDHPRLQPWVSDGEVTELLTQLAGRQIEVAIVESWNGAPAELPTGTRMTSLFTEDVELAVASNHPLAHQPRVSLAELTGHSWAACRVDSDTNRAMRAALRRHGITVELRYQVVDCVTQLALVAAGLAIALVPRSARPAEVPGVSFLTSCPLVRREVAVVTRSDDETPVVRAFLSELRDAAAKMANAQVARPPTGV